MTERVLIIGGYGNFGSYIARRLAEDENIQLIIAGRSLAKAEKMVSALNSANQPIAAQLDIHKNLDEVLAELKPKVVIHTSGPFQKQGYGVAEACIKAGSHYIDLADGREFVSNIKKLDKEAQARGVSVVSGASSVPCLSSCLIDHYKPEFSELQSVDYGITTAQRTNRGLATTEAILSYTGKPFKTLIGSKMLPVYGWQNIQRHSFPELGSRYLANCDIPDLSLFPERYPGLKTLRFKAGLELPILHIGLWGLSWLVRFKLIRRLDRWAEVLLRASFLFDKFGSDNSAFFMRLQGIGHNDKPKEINFDLTARSGDGPYIPCMPAILLAKKLAAGNALPAGAKPCIGLLTLDEYLAALKSMDIAWKSVSN